MADMILSSVFQVIIDKIASPVVETFSHMWDLKENIQKLQRTLPIVQALLDDAEEQQSTNTSVRIWVSKLKELAFEAEYLLLSFTGNGGLKDILSSDKVRQILLALETITDEGLRLNLRGIVPGGRGEWDRRETSSFVVESEVYGREEDRVKIIELLLSCESSRAGMVSCVLIEGMAGIGKTTLAQLVYNDKRVAKHFKARVWVFVSGHFDAKNIMTVVIESLTKDKCDQLNLDALHSAVWNLLRKKRYLIVLDDVWTESLSDWDKLKPLFRGGIDGSKILITTRSRRVALEIEIDSPTFPYQLNGLSEDACWSLFKKRAFRHGEEDNHPSLLPIGKQIVRKCGGLALAAKTLGSLMRFKREVFEWLFVRDSELWSSDECEKGILSALRLSYIHLPSHLKRCFEFCSMFPRNYEIEKDKLIHLWLAQGLIQSRSGRPVEDVGSDYFNDLLWMSFFQERKQGERNLVVGYKIHDVIYDLLQSLAGSDYAMLDRHLSTPSNLSKTHHLSAVFDFTTSAIPEELYEAKFLRTLLVFSGGNFGQIPSELFSKLKYLVVLDLSWSELDNVDGSIKCLLCLKFLDLSQTPIKKLPPAVEDLPLQTLNLFNCYDLVTLPNLLNMTSLRHLNNAGCESLTGMLPSPHTFKSDSREFRNMVMALSGNDNELFPRKYELQTLPLFVVGASYSMKFLGKLDLRGSLRITRLEKVGIGSIAKDAGMAKKKGIDSLELCWGDDDCYANIIPKGNNVVIRSKKRKAPESSTQSRRIEHEAQPSAKVSASIQSQRIEPEALRGEEVLMNLQPHEDLKRLVIKGYPAPGFPRWSIPYLNSIDLIRCSKSQHLPALGNLQFLKRISLCAMHGVKRIGTEFYCEANERPFPALEELVLTDFPLLEEWSSPDRGDGFPSLIKLVVIKCPKLAAMPRVPSLQHLELRDCRETLVHLSQNLTSLVTLAIEKVNDLFSFSGTFPANNNLLASLEIKSCPRLRSLPRELGNLASLKSLTIRWCSDLCSLPESLQALDALESLEIGDCHGLTALPDSGTRGLRNLRNLSIENCNNLTSLSFGFQHLTSLEDLTVMYCPSIRVLPRGIEYTSALRSLTILSCPELLYLPEGLQNLRALHGLEIRGCPGLKALPEWLEKLVSLRSLAISDCHNIRSLPEGMKHLTALQHLSIQDCPDLVEKCSQQSGEDWPKIAHVPYKYIGSPEPSHPSGPGSSSSS